MTQSWETGNYPEYMQTKESIMVFLRLGFLYYYNHFSSHSNFIFILAYILKCISNSFVKKKVAKYRCSHPRKEKQEKFCTKPWLASVPIRLWTVFLISPSTLAEVDLFPLLQPPSPPCFPGLSRPAYSFKVLFLPGV